MGVPGGKGALYYSLSKSSTKAVAISSIVPFLDLLLPGISAVSSLDTVPNGIYFSGSFVNMPNR